MIPFTSTNYVNQHGCGSQALPMMMLMLMVGLAMWRERKGRK